MTAANPLSPELSAWIAAVTGVPVARADEITGGASRTSFVITGADGAKWFLRRDTGHGPLSGTPFTLAREYGVLEFVQGKGVPVGKTYAFSPEHNAILMEFVPGHTTYQQRGTEAEEKIVRRNLMAAVLALQKIDTRGLGALGDFCGAPLRQAIPADLKVWRELYAARVRPREALLEFALNWLAHGMPDADTPSVIVHGDVGPGNFLVRDGAITALIDWEMVRVGHPLEDLACIIARALGAPFGAPGDHIANYEQLSGHRVDPRKLDYALALVITRWLIAMSMALARPSALQNVPMLFAFRQLNGRALTEAMGRVFGIEHGGDTGALTPDPTTGFIFSFMGESLAALAGAETVLPADAYKLRGLKDLALYLESYIAYGPEKYMREDIERIGALLGRSFNDFSAAQTAVCDHAAGVNLAEAKPLVEYLQWRTTREHAILHKSLGALADNVIRY